MIADRETWKRARDNRPDLVMTEDQLRIDNGFDAIFPELAYQQPLYRAALAGDLDIAFLEREFAIERPRRWARNMPLVAAIIDTVGKPAGPSTWRGAVPLVAWADIAVLHRAGAEKRHYRHAAELAKTHLKVLLVEAPAEAFEDWLEQLERRQELAVEVIR